MNKKETLVYCKTGINKKGESVFKYIPLSDVLYKGEKLSDYLDQLEKDNSIRDKKVKKLVHDNRAIRKSFAEIIKAVGGLNE